MTRFQIVHDADQVHIRVKAGNNEIVMSGEALHNRDDAYNTIMAIKEGAADALVEEINGRTRTILWNPHGSGLEQGADSEG